MAANLAEPTGRGTGDSIRPFASMSDADLRSVDFVLTDIDDTLTSDGLLTGRAYCALEELSAAGFIVVPVTGRPAGWCDLIARLWPVAAVVGENGAFYYAKGSAGGMERVYEASEDERAERREALGAVARKVSVEVPAARLSADQPFRENDLAVDFAEDVGPLSDREVERIVGCFESEGAVAKVSSIHVNGWFGSHDKLTMARRLLRERFGCDIARENGRVLYAGDSPNDGPMFAHFEKGVAVANYRPGAAGASEYPAFITRGAGGAGFAEIAERLMEVRLR